MKRGLIILSGVCGIIAVVIIILFESVTKEYVTTLERPGDVEQEWVYILEVVYDDRRMEIEFPLGSRQLTEAELSALFEKAFKQLETEILGENKSLGEVSYNLNLITELSDYNMSVDWYIEDTAFIDYWGNVSDVDKCESTSLIANVRYNGATEYGEELIVREHRIELQIVPKEIKEKSLEELLYEQLQRTDAKYRHEANIVLPDSLAGKKVYYSVRKSSDIWIFFILFIVAVVCLLYKKQSDRKEQQKKRSELLLQDYPELVMKLSLLIGAGMTPYNAFSKIANDYRQKDVKHERPGYEAVLHLVNQIRTGVGEADAYIEFGRRTGQQCYIKLSTLLLQNCIKGNAKLRETLSNEVYEAMENRKARAKKAGAQAGTKLLLPMLMLLGIVFVIIMIPAFMSF